MTDNKWTAVNPLVINEMVGEIASITEEKFNFTKERGDSVRVLIRVPFAANYDRYLGTNATSATHIGQDVQSIALWMSKSLLTDLEEVEVDGRMNYMASNLEVGGTLYLRNARIVFNQFGRQPEANSTAILTVRPSFAEGDIDYLPPQAVEEIVAEQVEEDVEALPW